MAEEAEVPSGMPNIRFDAAADLDAQATVNDFIDYTELFPSDLIRSLQLIGQLDRTYHQATAKVHELSKTYGDYPLLSSSERPDSLELRAQISQALDRATACRQAAAAEADRLYTTAERLSSRLTIIKAKLQALPDPPSRDPTPPPQSPQNTRSRRQDLHSGPRLTLHLDRARQSSQKLQKRRLFIPGEPLPSGPDDEYSGSDQSDYDLAESMRSTSMDLGADAPDQATRGGRPGRVKIQKAIKPPKLKIPKTPKIRLPGMMGTNVHSSVAGISTSNALAKLTPPPSDAKAGSRFRPWLRLTEYEMAFLRKMMKKNAVWTPSDTMIRRELAKDGRGRENYEKAKAHADLTGEPFLDEDPFIPGRTYLAPGEVCWSPPDAGDTHNRGMRLNEAKKHRKDKDKDAAREADQLEDVNRKMQLFGDQLKTLFSRNSPVALSPMTQQATLPKSSRKRKRDSDQPSTDANFQESPVPKRLKLGPPATIKILPKPAPKLAAKPGSPVRTITTTTQIPLAPAGTSSSPRSTTTTRRAATPAISLPDVKKNAATPTQPTAAQSRSRRTSVKPELALPSTPKEHRKFNIRPRSRGSVVSGKAASAEPPSHKESRELRELRRASVIETKPEFDIATAPRTTRGGRRPAPGLVTTDEDGKGKISVGKRKAAPKRKSSMAATQPKSAADNKGSSNEKVGGAGSGSAVVDDDWADVDPDEPTYCICNQVSYGTMIACENDECDKEWFHLQCVGLEEIPPRRAKWYCPDCRKRFGIDEKGNASSSISLSSGRR